MANTLREGKNGLTYLDYSSLLKTIIDVLQNPAINNPFTLSQDGNRLIIDVDEIAFQVASQRVGNPLGSSSYNAKIATVNLTQESKNEFIKEVQQIREILKQHLERQLTGVPIPDYVDSLSSELDNFKGKGNPQVVSLIYPFENKDSKLQKKRLTLEKKSSENEALLDFHKLTITVETQDFQEQLKASLSNFIEFQFEQESEDKHQELRYILEDLVNDKEKNSDFYRLIKLINEEALGKLKREAMIRYLEFLQEHIGEDKDNIVYLKDLIRRLRLIESYINDPDQEDGHYEVNYQEVSLNYRELFNRADAFEMLPIIPKIEGYLGESNDEQKGRKQCIFGLKLKLNGEVQTAGKKSSFDYNLDFLNSESQLHKEGLKKPSFKQRSFVEKVLKVALLYYFVFAGANPATEGYTPQADLDYDPISQFKNRVLPILQGSDEQAKQKILQGIKKGLEQYGVKQKLNLLKDLLTKFIKKNRANPLPSRNYALHVSVKQSILERDYSAISRESSLFKRVLQSNPKAALKYISIDSSNVDNTSLCTLPAHLSISDLQFFTTEDMESFSMDYDLGNVKVVPIILSPQDQRCQNSTKNLFSINTDQSNTNESQKRSEKLVEITYNNQRLTQEIFTDKENQKKCVYQISFALLAYTSLKVLLDSAKSRLFIPILRIHLYNEQNSHPEEKFMRALFHVISHLLNESHRSNCQGYCITDVKHYKTQNALTSLYSRVPKVFQLNTPEKPSKIEKLAIMIVSSRECDHSKNEDYKIANLYGEIIGINRQQDQSIRLYTYGTFSDNYGSRDIHSHPDVLIDEVNKLYRRGYKHLLYIAKSPYSTTLNMTEIDRDEELYFMSPSIIRSLKDGREDLKIYPVFYDKYFVVKLKDKDLKENSLYIQDTAELTNLVKDPHKRSVVFFNLFNGITVAKETEYNGVISYATLLNFYEEILDDTDIYTGLIDDSDLKNELLQYLTLYHFSKYEKSEKSDKKISFKLDPYEGIIGDKSIGFLSIFYHTGGQVKFNSLAFLTEVRKALNVHPETQVSQ